MTHRKRTKEKNLVLSCPRNRASCVTCTRPCGGCGPTSSCSGARWWSLASCRWRRRSAARRLRWSWSRMTPWPENRSIFQLWRDPMFLEACAVQQDLLHVHWDCWSKCVCYDPLQAGVDSEQAIQAWLDYHIEESGRRKTVGNMTLAFFFWQLPLVIQIVVTFTIINVPARKGQSWLIVICRHLCNAVILRLHEVIIIST